MAVVVVAAAYLAGAFLVTPPYSPHGLYVVPRACACGHRGFATVEDGALMLYVTRHHMRNSLGIVSAEDGFFTVTTPHLSPLRLQFTFWGCRVQDRDGSWHFYPRDYLYPLSLFARFQTQRGAPGQVSLSHRISP